MRELSDAGLEDCACKQEGGASPEGFEGRAVKFLSDNGEGNREGGTVKGDHQGEDGKGEEGQVEAAAGIEYWCFLIVLRGRGGGARGYWLRFCDGLNLLCFLSHLRRQVGLSHFEHHKV